MAIKFPSSVATKQTNSQKSEYSPQATATCDSPGFYCVYTRTSVEMEDAQFYLAAFTLLEDPKSTQRNFLVPVSLCPRTRAGAKIPGQTPLSWDVPGQNEFIFTYIPGGFVWCDGPFYLVKWPQEKWACDFHDDALPSALVLPAPGN